MTDSKEKTVYLLGAGASANVLPVAEKMPDDMISLAEKLAKDFPSESDSLAEGIRAVAEKSKERGSVDQYAYELSKAEAHFASEEYTSLRFMLTAYMLLKQIHNAPDLDNRYRAWLDTVCAPNHSFSWSGDETERHAVVENRCNFVPQNICALTYNYDFQMEMAFYQSFLFDLVGKGVPFFSEIDEKYRKKFDTVYDFDHAEMPLNFFSARVANVTVLSNGQASSFGLVGSLPTVCFRGEITEFDIENYFYVSNWSCFHLNGMCDTSVAIHELWGPKDRTAVRKMMRIWNTFNLPESFREAGKEEFIACLLKVAGMFSSDDYRGTQQCWNLFGWDMHNKIPWSDTHPNYLQQKISGAKNLVVIGYSFPEFNRWMDRRIFNSLNKDDSLKRIYIQNPDIQDIPGSLLRAAGDVKVIPITDVKEFFVPDAVCS